VFFDFNKSDITAEAARVIQQAADHAKRGGVSRIIVTGHTDTSTGPRESILGGLSCCATAINPGCLT
jgi:outer membrane protein OmpA-like peptidoglycan-associated protein